MGPITVLTGQDRRLPDRLADLHGPWEGTVVLPVHLTWYGLREFDVGRTSQRLRMYSIVISQGRRNELARFLNARRLREDWPQLRQVVSGKVRRAVERKLGLGPGDARGGLSVWDRCCCLGRRCRARAAMACPPAAHRLMTCANT